MRILFFFFCGEKHAQSLGFCCVASGARQELVGAFGFPTFYIQVNMCILLSSLSSSAKRNRLSVIKSRWIWCKNFCLCEWQLECGPDFHLNSNLFIANWLRLYSAQSKSSRALMSSGWSQSWKLYILSNLQNNLFSESQCQNNYSL